MDLKEAIEKRKSIRSYSEKEVSDNLIKEVLEAARLAPSGNNSQPSKYLVIKSKEAKKELSDNDVFVQKFVCDAPVLIICCSDTNAYTKNISGVDDANKIRALRDVSIASSYLTLRATELGLGTCYVGWRDEVKIKKMFNLPEEYVIPYVITLGFYDKEPPARERKTFEEIFLGFR
ncbi:MAG: nitroreductase family protein [Nanoarchaeota archaeon]|jgi:nitroreductase|nr:nitroreductase family protein [Nanoarchaeota archaeon]